MVKFELNSKGVVELLKSPEMDAVLSEKAAAIQGRCGDGYEVETAVGRDRVTKFVKADGFMACLDNYKNNTLLKAMGG